MEIITTKRKESEKVLREKAEDFVFADFTKKEIKGMIATMRRAMKDANGIGLAANQVGLPYRMFIAEIPDEQGRTKFYALVNPTLEKISKNTRSMEEGCLSVPGIFGSVERAERVTLAARDKNNHAVKIKAWGLLAHVLQHEMDHLSGVLFIDKAKNLHTLPTLEQSK